MSAIPAGAPEDTPLHIAMLTPLSTRPLLRLLHDPPPGLPPGIGGPGPTDLIQALIAAGHRVSAISTEPTITAPLRVGGGRLDLTLVPMRATHRGRDAYAKERCHLVDALRQVSAPDVVHAQWTYEFAMAARHGDAPYLVTARDWAPLVLRYNPIPYWVVKLGMNIDVLRRRPHLTTPSPSVQRRLQRLGFRDVRHIPNGLRVAEVAVEQPRTAARRPATLLSVTNEFSGRKNTSTLLEAFAIIRRRFPQSRLRLAGIDHGPGEKAQAWARERGLERGVDFLGQIERDRVLQLMGTADVLVHPAREEPFGIVVIEAMSQGLPVVGGMQAGGVPFILDNGRAGEVVDVDLAVDIATGVLALLKDDARYADRSAAGLTRVRERFDINRIAADYVQAYRDLLAGRW